MIETGVKGVSLNNKLSGFVAIYQIRITNVAVNANDPNPNLYIQRGEETSNGAEAELQGTLLPNLTANFSYAYNVAEITKSIVVDEIGKIKENAPRHSSASWLKYTFDKGKLKGLGISVGHLQAGKRNTLLNDFSLPGYIILNTSIHYTHNHFIIACNLNNVTNVTYWKSAYNNINKWPGEPRNFLVKIGYHF
jgi:iron complex outermembrane receptor protein